MPDGPVKDLFAKTFGDLDLTHTPLATPLPDALIRCRRSVKGAMPTDPTGTKRGRTKKEEQKTPPKYGPPTGGLTLVSFRGVTVTANKLANLPIIQ